MTQAVWSDSQAQSRGRRAEIGSGGAGEDMQDRTLCYPMDCSMPGSPVLHYLLEFAQIHVRCVSDAIQPSVVPFFPHPQSFPASGFFPVRQLFTSGGQLFELHSLITAFHIALSKDTSCIVHDSERLLYLWRMNGAK